MDINKEIADIKKILNILIEMQKEKGKEVHNHYHYHNEPTIPIVNPWLTTPIYPHTPVWTITSTNTVGPDEC